LISLVAGAQEAGIDLGPDQQASFQSYFRLLEERGRQVNLTGVHGWHDVREELFLRSMRVLAVGDPPMPDVVRARGAGYSAIDVGSGAGVPGLVLKLALPGLSMTLLDATRKKTDFLSDVVRELKLVGVRVANDRAEVAGHDKSLREAFDIVAARSLAKLAELAELTLPFCRVGGVVLAHKAADVGEELAAARFAFHALGGDSGKAIAVERPGSGAPDTVVLVRKVKPSPRRYPRRPGLPHERPLIEERRPPGGARLTVLTAVAP
jgi:16S rRNA (guanine527-N7)-methyltransferase